MKQKLWAQVFKQGCLWLTEQQIDEKLSLLGLDDENGLALKC